MGEWAIEVARGFSRDVTAGFGPVGRQRKTNPEPEDLPVALAPMCPRVLGPCVMSKSSVFYLSVSRGITNPDGSRPVAYFGKVFRIPRSEHGSLRQLEWEMTPEDLLADLTSREGNSIQYVPDGVVERFEIYDQDSGDVWVMYRVPYQEAR